MSSNYVFTYGTLKQGEPNHHWLSNLENGNGKFYGLANTVQKFPLVIASRYNIPYVLAATGKGNVSNDFILHLSKYVGKYQ